MAKIIVEHVTKKPKVKLNVFVGEKNVGSVNHQAPLEFDVTEGEHRIHIGFGKKKAEGVGIVCHAVENAPKKIQTSLTRSALFAARWHYFLLMAAVMAFVMVATRLLMGSAVRQEHIMFALIFLPVTIPIYFFIQAKHKSNPKNFVDMNVVE